MATPNMPVSAARDDRERHAPSSGITAVASTSTSHSGRARAKTTRPVETGYTPLMLFADRAVDRLAVAGIDEVDR